MRVEVQSAATAESEESEESWLIMGFLLTEMYQKFWDVDCENATLVMKTLCGGSGLEAAVVYESPIDGAIVRLMDRAGEWGQPEPDVTQFLAAYVVTGAEC